MKIPFVFVLLAFALAGCRVELPAIESAFVAKTWITSDSPHKTALSPAQIERLQAWFDAHQDGWKFEVADIAPDTFLLFRQKNGQETWAYLTGNRVWIRNRVRLLAPDERAALDSIVTPFHLNKFL